MRNRIVSNAACLRRLAEAALHEFDGQWRYDSFTGSGHYVFEDSDPMKASAGPETPVSFNGQLAAGRALIYLWKVTGYPSYRHKVEGLAWYFKKHLVLDFGGGLCMGLLVRKGAAAL